MPPVIRTINLSKSDFCHAPSKVMISMSKGYPGREDDQLLAVQEMPCDEARRFFQDGLALCDKIEAEYLASLAGTLAAAIDNGITRDQIEYGLQRTGFKLTDPNFKQGFQA